jgi:hypothetical protein
LRGNAKSSSKSASGVMTVVIAFLRAGGNMALSVAPAFNVASLSSSSKSNPRSSSASASGMIVFFGGDKVSRAFFALVNASPPLISKSTSASQARSIALARALTVPVGNDDAPEPSLVIVPTPVGPLPTTVLGIFRNEDEDDAVDAVEARGRDEEARGDARSGNESGRSKSISSSSSTTIFFSAIPGSAPENELRRGEAACVRILTSDPLDRWVDAEEEEVGEDEAERAKAEVGDISNESSSSQLSVCASMLGEAIGNMSEGRGWSKAGRTDWRLEGVTMCGFRGLH